MSNWIQDVRNALQGGDLAEGLKEFIAHNQDPNTENTLILLSGRWNRLRQQEQKGLVSYDQANLERNRIQAALLDVLQDQRPQAKPASEENRNQTTVTGDGNIVIQGVSGSTINIYPDKK